MINPASRSPPLTSIDSATETRPAALRVTEPPLAKPAPPLAASVLPGFVMMSPPLEVIEMSPPLALLVVLLDCTTPLMVTLPAAVMRMEASTQSVPMLICPAVEPNFCTLTAPPELIVHDGWWGQPLAQCS